MKVPGVPYDQGVNVGRAIAPTAIVLHRTYGSWLGDYHVGKRGRPDGPGIGFHFLVGKASTRWAQFYDTTQQTGHAKGAGSWSVGLEFEGTNEEPLTDWQVAAGAHIIGAVCDHHGIPRTYYDGPRQRVAGCLPHASVPGSDHTDRLTRADWDRIAARWAPPPTPTPPPPPPGHTPTTEVEMSKYITDGRTIARVTDTTIRPYANQAQYDLDRWEDARLGRDTTVETVSAAGWALWMQNRALIGENP